MAIRFSGPGISLTTTASKIRQLAEADSSVLHSDLGERGPVGTSSAFSLASS